MTSPSPISLQEKKMSQTALTVTDQKTVTFYDSEIIAIRDKTGRVYASITHICDVLGIDPNSQRRRIQRHDVMGEGYQMGKIETPGGPQQMGLIRADYIPLWLTTMRVSMVKEEFQERLLYLQKEAAQVLWEAFQEGRLTADPTFEELLQQESETVEAYRMIQAMLKLARNQIMMEARLDQHEGRLEQLEAKLGDPDRLITPDQASQISQAVKAIAIEIGRNSKRNEFGAVYGELYRKFGITSYKELPTDRFREAMAFLREWYQSLTDQSIPF
jgi:hypothetical protein